MQAVLQLEQPTMGACTGDQKISMISVFIKGPCEPWQYWPEAWKRKAKAGVA